MGKFGATLKGVAVSKNLNAREMSSECAGSNEARRFNFFSFFQYLFVILYLKQFLQFEYLVISFRKNSIFEALFLYL